MTCLTHILHGLMEVAGCSRRSYFGTTNGNVVDLTEEADDVLSGNIQTGNLMEDSTRLNPAANLNESLIHIASDSEGDTLDGPLRFKRKRARSVRKYTSQVSEPSNNKHTCQQLPLHESERTLAACVFSNRPSPSTKGERNKNDGTPGKERPWNTYSRRKNKSIQVVKLVFLNSRALLA
ncbi:unnamed protein product [Rhodiola kirilowii]